MTLPSAEGGAITNALGEIAESPQVARGCLVRSACLWSLRHDLPPVETSQVIRILLGDESVAYKEVFPAIVIQISEERTPCPSPHGSL